MARIRSIHPGLFTDEAYMALSFPSRELLKGIWCEADDQGVFDWKPLTLKARILPADNVDVSALLAELQTHRFVLKFEVDGRPYGAVRNFTKFQRPKKPNAIFPLPKNIRGWTGLEPIATDNSPTGTELVPHQDGTSGGKPPQMEDGGWRMEDGGWTHAAADAGARPPARASPISLPAESHERAVYDALGWQWGDPQHSGTATRLGMWLASGADLDLDILPTLRRLSARNGTAPKTAKYFDQAIADAVADRLKPMPTGAVNGKPHGPQRASADDMLREARRSQMQGMGRVLSDRSGAG